MVVWILWWSMAQTLRTVSGYTWLLRCVVVGLEAPSLGFLSSGLSEQRAGPVSRYIEQLDETGKLFGACTFYCRVRTSGTDPTLGVVKKRIPYLRCAIVGDVYAIRLNHHLGGWRFTVEDLHSRWSVHGMVSCACIGWRSNERVVRAE